MSQAPENTPENAPKLTDEQRAVLIQAQQAAQLIHDNLALAGLCIERDAFGRAWFLADNQPLAQITSLEALNQYKERLANDIVEAEMRLHMDIPPEGIQHPVWGTVTKPSLIAALTQAKKDERISIPARERFLSNRTQATQSAFEKFPFLKDPTHPGYQMAQAAKRDPANAWLRGLPNADYILGVQIKGLLAMQAEEAATTVAKPAKPKQKPTSGQSEIASDASISRAPTGVVNSQALQVEIAKITGGKKSLGHKDFAQVLLAKQRFRNSQ